MKKAPILRASAISLQLFMRDDVIFRRIVNKETGRLCRRPPAKHPMAAYVWTRVAQAIFPQVVKEHNPHTYLAGYDKEQILRLDNIVRRVLENYA